MKYPQGNWVMDEKSQIWYCFVEQTILNNGKSLKWFDQTTLDPNESPRPVIASVMWGHLCPLRGDECICREIRETFEYDALVGRCEMKDGNFVYKNDFYRSYVVQNGKFIEIPLKGCNKLTLALEAAEKMLLLCDCGAAKLSLPHSHWCSRESYRRANV